MILNIAAGSSPAYPVFERGHRMGIIKRIDHVSIGVEDISRARSFLTDVLGGDPLPDQGDSPEGFRWETFMLGGKKVELVSPHTPGEGGVGRYIAKRGEGYHHISVAVENLDAALAYFESKGIAVLGVNRDNLNFQHFYLHPKQTFGAMIQVFEENDHTRSLAGDKG